MRAKYQDRIISGDAIVSRMSEDVDFKIQLKQPETQFSKTRFLKELKQFRTYIKSELNLPGLIAGEPIVRNEGQYSRIDLAYSSYFPAHAGLRAYSKSWNVTIFKRAVIPGEAVPHSLRGYGVSRPQAQDPVEIMIGSYDYLDRIPERAP